MELSPDLGEIPWHQTFPRLRVKGPGGAGMYDTVPRRAEPRNTLFIMDHYDIEGRCPIR